MTVDEPLYEITTRYVPGRRENIKEAAVFAACPGNWPQQCCACDNKVGPFLCVDSSGGEYGSVDLCEECIRKAFEAARGTSP